MGLLDKYIAKMAGPAPDMNAIMGPLLGEGDQLLAWSTAIAESFERGGGVGSGFNALLNTVVNAALTANAQGKHVGGSEDSIAMSLPRDSDPLTLVISRTGLSAWRGPNYQGDVPKAYYRIAKESISSVTDTGKRAQGGAQVVRVSFVDGSFFDYRLMLNCDEFLAACDQRWPAS